MAVKKYKWMLILFIVLKIKIKKWNAILLLDSPKLKYSVDDSENKQNLLIQFW